MGATTGKEKLGTLSRGRQKSGGGQELLPIDLRRIKGSQPAEKPKVLALVFGGKSSFANQMGESPAGATVVN